MKLLLVYPTAMSNIFFTRIAPAFVREGIDVTLACNLWVGKRVEFPPGVKIRHLDLPRGMSLFGVGASVVTLRRAVREVKPDIIHVHFGAAMFVASLAREKDWPPVIGTFHGLVYPYETGPLRPLYALAEKIAAHRLKNLIVLTEEDARILERDVPGVKVYIPGEYGLGIDLDNFDPARFSAESRVELRRRHGFTQEDVLAVYVGRMEHRKGFHLAIRALRALLPEHPRTGLLLVGEPDTVHPLGLSRDELQWARTSPRVAWTGFQQDVAPLLHASDFLIMPSYRESMGICIQEAMAMGVPCLTTASIGPNHLIDNGVDGIKVGIRDLDGIIQAWRTLLVNPDLRLRLGKAAMTKRNLFDFKVSFSEHLKLYRSLVGSGHQPAGAGS